MDKVDILMQTMGSSRAVLPSYSDLVEDIPEVVVMTREELEVKIVGLLETFNDCDMIEISKYVRIHTELHSSGQKMLSIAHNRLAKRGRSWKDFGFPKKHPDILEKVKTFTNMTSRTGMTGPATGSSMSRQISLSILSTELVRKIMSLLNMKESEVFEEEEEEDVGPKEENPLGSQDFPAYTQSQGSDTVRVRKSWRCIWRVTPTVLSVERGSSHRMI